MGPGVRGPEKDPNKYTAGRGMKGKREEGEMKGGQFKSSECQVLMCLFSITAVPGSDREGKQTATLMYRTQTRNSGLVAISLRRDVSSRTLPKPAFFFSFFRGSGKVRRGSFCFLTGKRELGPLSVGASSSSLKRHGTAALVSFATAARRPERAQSHHGARSKR